MGKHSEGITTTTKLNPVNVQAHVEQLSDDSTYFMSSFAYYTDYNVCVRYEICDPNIHKKENSKSTEK